LAARLGARPAPGPSATCGETEARGDGAGQQRGEPPKEPVLAHDRSATGHCPCGDPLPALSSLEHPCRSRCLGESRGSTSPGHPPALVSPGCSTQAAGEGRDAGVQRSEGGMTPHPSSHLPSASLCGARRIPPCHHPSPRRLPGHPRPIPSAGWGLRAPCPLRAGPCCSVA